MLKPLLEPAVFSPDHPRFLAITGRSFGLDDEVARRAAEIVSAVRLGGGDALLEQVRRWDGEVPSLESLRVSPAEISRAVDEVGGEFMGLLDQAVKNIRKFHQYQVRRGYVHVDGDGVALAKRVLPLARVGVYCPAGSAPLFSSLLMNVVPAKLAGVGEIAVAVPPRRDGSVSPHILAAAASLELNEIYRMGGAQAVAALAYGAGPVRRVDKIVGPGNAYVAAAKRLVFGSVGIDALAGPSEIAIVADDGADPEFVAADLLSQTEHGSGCESGVLLTDSPGLAEAVCAAVERRLAALSRAEAIRLALSRYGAVFVTASLEEAFDAVNVMAPEHLEILTREPREWLDLVLNAGAVFLGPWSSEPVGDYFAGTNHVLPTCGAARFSSSLGVADFQKDMSVIEYSRERLRKAGPGIIRLAGIEGLSAHAEAVRARLDRMASGE
jgi:histidinol dehydrogenase